MMITDSLTNLTTGMGTDRDKSAATVYERPSTYAVQEFVAAYETSPTAYKVCSMLPRDATREWRGWQGEADQIAALEKEEKRLGVKQKVRDQQEQANVYGDAYLYMSVKNQDPSEPLEIDRVGAGDLEYVLPMHRDDIAKGEIDTDPLSPEYGMPKFYQVSSGTQFLNIHPSRIIKFYGRKRNRSALLGHDADSILLSILPSVKRYDAVMHNIAGMTHDARARVLYIRQLAAQMQNSEDVSKVLARAKLFQMGISNFGIGLLDAGDPNNDADKGEKLEETNTNFSALADIIDKMQEGVSAAAECPRALLFGTTAGGMGSTGELELSAWYNRVQDYQANTLEPAIYALDECLIRSAIGGRPDELHYNWRSLESVSDESKVSNADKLASAIQKLVSSGVIPADAMTEAAVNAMTELGAIPGLEAAFNDWMAGAIDGGEL